MQNPESGVTPFAFLIGGKRSGDITHSAGNQGAIRTDSDKGKSILNGCCNLVAGRNQCPFCFTCQFADTDHAMDRGTEIRVVQLVRMDTAPRKSTAPLLYAAQTEALFARASRLWERHPKIGIPTCRNVPLVLWLPHQTRIL